MKYGYARVSGLGQDLTGQIDWLKAEGCEKIFSEKYTGAKTDRPQFQALLKELKENDTLVVTKLDRFARTTGEALQVIKDMFNRGIKVHVLNMGLIENTPTGNLIFTILMSFAEFERNMIVERTQEGKAAARQRMGKDFKEGRPNKYTREQIKHALELLESNTYKRVVELTGISKATIIRERQKLQAKELKEK